MKNESFTVKLKCTRVRNFRNILRKGASNGRSLIFKQAFFHSVEIKGAATKYPHRGPYNGRWNIAREFSLRLMAINGIVSRRKRKNIYISVQTYAYMRGDLMFNPTLPQSIESPADDVATPYRVKVGSRAEKTGEVKKERVKKKEWRKKSGRLRT